MNSPPRIADVPPVRLDELDLDLIAALQLSPRAGHPLLAEALQVSKPTVSRRLSRLREERVLGCTVQVPWWVRSETHPQHVWLRAAAGSATKVAAAVAALPQAQYVAVTSGQSEVYCIVEAERREDMAELLTTGLPTIEGVTASRAELGLRQFATAAGWLLRRLPTKVEAHLGGGEVNDLPAETPVDLRDEELRAVRALQSDGRCSSAQLARQLDTSPSTAYRMVQSLLERRIVVPRVQVEPRLLGFPLEVVVTLVAEPGRMTELATTLARHPSTRYVATVAGHTSVMYHGVFTHETELAAFLSDDLATLPGVSGLEVSIVLRVVIRYWSRQERLPDMDQPSEMASG